MADRDTEAWSLCGDVEEVLEGEGEQGEGEPEMQLTLGLGDVSRKLCKLLAIGTVFWGCFLHVLRRWRLQKGSWT